MTPIHVSRVTGGSEVTSTRESQGSSNRWSAERSPNVSASCALCPAPRSPRAAQARGRWPGSPRPRTPPPPATRPLPSPKLGLSGCPYCWPRLSLCGLGDTNGWVGHTFQPTRKKKKRVRICIDSGRDSPSALRAYAADRGKAQLPLPHSLLPAFKKNNAQRK